MRRGFNQHFPSKRLVPCQMRMIATLHPPIPRHKRFRNVHCLYLPAIKMQSETNPPMQPKTKVTSPMTNWRCDDPLIFHLLALREPHARVASARQKSNNHRRHVRNRRPTAAYSPCPKRIEIYVPLDDPRYGISPAM